jgi:hypothetical protein
MTMPYTGRGIEADFAVLLPNGRYVFRNVVTEE